MAMQGYNTVDPRIGALKGDILPHAIPVMCLGITGDQKKVGKNQSDTIIYRRWLPKGGATTNSTTINQWSVDPAAHRTTEGVTPTAETMTAQNITVQLEEYACLYSYSSKVAELYEDKIPTEMKTQVGERMGLLKEMISYGTLKACTNKFYAGGTSRATVDEAISLSILRRASRSIQGNRGQPITSVLSASVLHNTSPVEGGYVVYCHTDCVADVRNLPGFISSAEYGSRKMLHPREFGSVEDFRFISSPELGEIADAGAAVGSTGLLSTSASNIDVYPYIVVGKDAWADVALRGMESVAVIEIPYDKPDKSDPLGQRGYLGARTICSAFIQNDGWMCVLEAGASSLA